MNEVTFIDLMDKYLEGDLNEKEVLDFEKILLENESMKETFSFHKKSREAIKLKARNEKLQELRSIKESMADVETKNSLFKRKKSTSNQSIIRKLFPFGIAASVLLIVIFYFLNSSNDLELIETRFVQIDLKPKEGLLGAAPSIEVKVNVYCCSESIRVEKLGDSVFSIYISEQDRSEWRSYSIKEYNENIKLIIKDAN